MDEVRCPACLGASPKMDTCMQCNKTGKVEPVLCSVCHAAKPAMDDCQRCNGTGRATPIIINGDGVEV